MKILPKRFIIFKEVYNEKIKLIEFRGGGTHSLAFTLAEVLITLGVIGVVAAMTMPVLIQNHQKRFAATRLKHFSSLMQQAAKMRENDIINGSLIEMSPTEVKKFNSDDMEKFYNIYFAPYVKTNSTLKVNRGLAVQLANGSGVFFIRDLLGTASVTSNMYLTFCTEYKYCTNIEDHKAVDGRHTFSLWAGGTVPREYKYSAWTRETLLENARKNKYYCSALIEYDGWEIKDDYPCW